MIFLVGAVVILSCGLYVSIKKNLEMLDRLDAVGLQIEECVETLDECHQKIDLKSKMEVFSDEHVVKELLQDMKDAKSSIYLVAKKLYDIAEEGGAEITDENDT
jgi:hypothetical protein